MVRNRNFVAYDENILIRAVKRGSRKACNALYDRHADLLYRFLRQYSADAAQVEDWVQRAFIKAFSNIESFSQNSKFSTWLFTIALNELRTDKRRRALTFIDPAELCDIQDEPSTSFEWEDAMKVLLKDLDVTKRTVFLLYEAEGYSHAEIGSILGITENLSRTIFCRAKNILRSRWDIIKDAI